MVSLMTEHEKMEYFDEPKVLEYKVTKLAELIKKSNNLIAFTGAGISTAAGIPDYRSGKDTIVETGPGTQREMVNLLPTKDDKLESRSSTHVRINDISNEAFPTRAHLALKELIDRDICKGIITQNLDGLHRKSGISLTQLYELHGNMNLEVCEICNKNYLRTFIVRNEKDPKIHNTSRKCKVNSCKGQLVDTIINFGDPLNIGVAQGAVDIASKADLMLTIGSSFNARPANRIPLYTCWNGGKLVMINL